jgi:prevent-host-death family protein
MYMYVYIENQTMTERHSIAEARSNLPKLVREAERGNVVELTRRGESVAVLIGRRQFEQLTSSYRSFAEAYGNFAKVIDLAELAIDPDEVFAGSRDDTRGREVRL